MAPSNADQAEFKTLFTFLEIPFAEVDPKPTPLPTTMHRKCKWLRISGQRPIQSAYVYLVLACSRNNPRVGLIELSL